MSTFSLTVKGKTTTKVAVNRNRIVYRCPSSKLTKRGKKYNTQWPGQMQENYTQFFLFPLQCWQTFVNYWILASVSPVSQTRLKMVPTVFIIVVALDYFMRLSPHFFWHPLQFGEPDLSFPLAQLDTLHWHQHNKETTYFNFTAFSWK